MRLFLKIFFLLFLINASVFASKINILYDVQSNGKIDPKSQWILEMISEAGTINNISVNFEGAPWIRALELLKDGVADGLINASYKRKRARYAVYPRKDGKLDVSKSLKTPAYYLYKRKDHKLEFDGKQLINAEGKISAVQSYAVVDNLKKLNAKIQLGINTNSNLNNVLYGNFIASAELESEADPIIRANKQLKDSIEKLPIPIRKKEYYLIIAKKYYENHGEDVHKLWNTIEELKKTDKYKKHIK